MKISDLITKDSCLLGANAADREQAIDILVSLHDRAGNLTDSKAFREAILEREAKGSTAIGLGIAVPHSKTAAVKKTGVAAITVTPGIDYKSLDGNPTNLIFMIAAPDNAADTHLEVLSQLTTLLMDHSFAKELMEAKTVDEFLNIIKVKES